MSSRSSAISGHAHGLTALLELLGRAKEQSGGTLRLDLRSVVADDEYLFAYGRIWAMRGGRTLDCDHCVVFRFATARSWKVVRFLSISTPSMRSGSECELRESASGLRIVCAEGTLRRSLGETSRAPDLDAYLAELALARQTQGTPLVSLFIMPETSAAPDEIFRKAQSMRLGK